MNKNCKQMKLLLVNRVHVVRGMVEFDVFKTRNKWSNTIFMLLGWTSRTGQQQQQQDTKVAECCSGQRLIRLTAILRPVPASVPIRNRESFWSIATSAVSDSSWPVIIRFSSKLYEKVWLEREEEEVDPLPRLLPLLPPPPSHTHSIRYDCRFRSYD